MTEREKSIYDYIIKFKQINGFSPNFNEIAMANHISRTHAKRCVYRLHDKGILEISQKDRGIKVLQFL